MAAISNSPLQLDHEQAQNFLKDAEDGMIRVDRENVFKRVEVVQDKGTTDINIARLKSFLYKVEMIAPAMPQRLDAGTYSIGWNRELKAVDIENYLDTKKNKLTISYNDSQLSVYWNNQPSSLTAAQVEQLNALFVEVDKM